MRPVQARPFDELIELANKAISIIHSNQQKDQDSLAEPLSEKCCPVLHPPLTTNLGISGISLRQFIHQFSA
jgi:hypothetical protein